MILTVTLNPTIDRVFFVRDFHIQELTRAEREVVCPSGKGIDVSLLAHIFGAETMAIALNAGHSGQLLAALLDEQEVAYDFIPAHGQTRTSVLITDVANGHQSTIVAPTLTAEPAHLEQVLARVAHYARRSWGLVCAGSIPPGLPAESYRQILAEAHRQGLITLLDSSGEGLRQGVVARPHILKINARELGELAPAMLEQQGMRDQLPVTDGVPSDLRWLAGALAERLGEWASQALVVTLGKRGALAVTTEGRFYAPALDAPLVSAAGAGDAVSAGLMMARRKGQSWRDALALGVAMAAAVVMNEGTSACSREQVHVLLPRSLVYSLR